MFLPRYTVVHSRHTNTWSMEIAGVVVGDHGQYQCQAPTSTGVRTNSYWLRVRQPSLVILGSREKHVTLGDTIAMTCELRDSGENTEHLTWVHNNDLVRGQDRVTVSSTVIKSQPRNLSTRERKIFLSELKILKTKLTDSGNYSCSTSSLSSEATTLFVSPGRNIP